MRPLALLAVLAACGDNLASSWPTDAPASSDAAVDGQVPSTCIGACRTTAFTATFGSVTRTFDRAYYGILNMQTTSIVHVEAYTAAVPACPTRSSPSADYTVVFNDVGLVRSASAVAYLMDFTGDLLDNHVAANAGAVTAQTVAIDTCPTCVGMPAPADPDGFIAIDAALTFTTGTIAGHVYATHCDSLDRTL